MPITNSQIISESLQADGSRLVHERHTDHNGLVHEWQYLAPADWDIRFVLRSRAVTLSAEIDLREAQEAEARDYHLSISPADFMGRFSPQEWGAFKALAASNSTADYLWSMFAQARSINTRDPRVIQAVQFLVMTGVLTATSAAEVLL